MTATTLKRILCPAILLVAELCCSTRGSAQEMHPYAGATVEISTWGVHSWSGCAALTYNNTSEKTSVIGSVGEAGWFMGRNVAVGAEFEWPGGRNNVTSVHGYFSPYV